jgi:hypothetical protein
MQSVKAMRQEVGTATSPDGGSWSRIVFIAAICALGGIGFLGATIVMNGRASSFVQRPAAPQAADVQGPSPATTPEPAPKSVSKPKPAINDRFQPVDFAARADVNKATLARCRAHIEAGRPFEELSAKRVAEMRDSRRGGDYDPEAICRDYILTESRAGR